MEKVRLHKEENGLSVIHPLNQMLEIPFMEAEGSYHVIAMICGLEYIGNGIFAGRKGRHYILTKFGFEDVVQYNWEVKYAELVQEYRKLKSDYDILEENCERKIKGMTKGLQDQVDSKNKKIKGQADHINQLVDKIKGLEKGTKEKTFRLEEKTRNQSIQIQHQKEKLKKLYALLAENGVDWNEPKDND